MCFNVCLDDFCSFILFAKYMNHEIDLFYFYFFSISGNKSAYDRILDLQFVKEPKGTLTNL